MRTPLLWVAVNNTRAVGLPKIQACVRGWIVRKRLGLAGPGVLSRKNLVNDEELVSGNEKERQHPMDYFAFEENGKVWWFSFSSIWAWSTQALQITNPYTKQLLDADTRKRLRALWGFRGRHREPQPEESAVYEQRLCGRLVTICQLFADNGFVDVRPDAFMEFRKAEYTTAFLLLGRDIETVFRPSDPFREKAIRLCARAGEAARHMPPNQYILHSVYTLKWLLFLHKDPYAMAFSVLSALYRC
jgi:hypothetical protein